MSRDALRSLWMLLFPVATLLGYASDDPIAATVSVLLGSLVILGLFEFLLGRMALSPITELPADARSSGRLGISDFRVLIPYSLLPLHLAALILGLHSVAHREAGALWLIYAVPVGITGSMSLLIAHEFMHTYSPLETFLSRAAGACQFWGVHELEHLQIHHRLDISCTEEDTSYAKLGQSVYSYIPLSVFHNYRNAWRTERQLLQRKNQPVLSPRNRVVRTVFFSLLATLIVALVFGRFGTLFFLIQATVSMMQFMLTTYNQHYGLTRRRRPDGTYEPFTFMNTWSSDLKITNWTTANLATHAHHHLDPFCPYYNLKLIEHSPILPFGYLAMSGIALIPPLWFRIMDKRVKEVFERRDALEQRLI